MSQKDINWAEITFRFIIIISILLFFLLIFLLTIIFITFGKDNREYMPLNDPEVRYTLVCDAQFHRFLLKFEKEGHPASGGSYFIGSSSTNLDDFCDTEVNAKAHIRDGYGQMLCYGNEEECKDFDREAMVIDIEEISKK